MTDPGRPRPPVGRPPWPLILLVVALTLVTVVAVHGRVGPPGSAAVAPVVERSHPPHLAPGAGPAGDAGPPIATAATVITPASGALTSALRGAIGPLAGCAMATQDGQTLSSIGATTPLATASTQKLLVAAAALARLGPDYRFVTRLEAARPVADGQVGRLWLVGSGDPTLSTGGYRSLVDSTDHLSRPAPFTPIEWLARSARAAGIVSVPGGISGDEALFSDQRYVPAWKPSYISEDDVGPLSALTLNEGWQNFETATAPAANPPAYAASTLSGLMRHDGVSVGPIGPDSVAPAGAVTVATVSSAPLSQIVGYMLSVSDNHVAELLTRLVGREVSGVGTTAAGTQAVLEEADALGIPTAGAVMVDGSGLSTENRATCPELLAAYQLGYQSRFSALHAGLPVVGETGTLYDVWAGTPLAGKIVAKTGWIDGVGAIVGTVYGRDPVNFAFAVNGNFDYTVAYAAETRVVNALYAYSNST